MFKRKTVFIVGAGGSKELNLPIGDELKLSIGAKVDLRFSNGYDLSVGDKNILAAIRRLLDDAGERDVNPHCQAGRSIASAMHQAISIDNYLHTHAEDETLVTVGKLGIAACILEAERKSKIFGDERSDGRINFAAHPDVWHNTFCKMLSEGVQRKNIDTLFDNVSFITFNYDRCIEHYIAQWVENYMQVPTLDAQELMTKLTIIHPYGQIGRLPWQKSGLTPVRFGSAVDPITLPRIAGHIRTFTEQVEDEAILERMQDLILDAQQIVYLGFSYGSMNMELMKLRTQPRGMKTVRGTAYKMSPSNVSAISELIDSTMFFSGRSFVGTRSYDSVTCNDLLNNYSRSLTI
jgi:hypothetical protein